MNWINAIHKPSDCLLLSAFALTEQEFNNELKEETDKDYAKGVLSKYKFLPQHLYKYKHNRLVQTIEKVGEKVQQLGVTVKLHAKLEDLHNLTSFKVITLIAHFNDNRKLIELSDKLHTTQQFVDAVDKNFQGFWDLSVCNSIHLQDCLKNEFGDQCIVRANKGLAEIKFHLVLYQNIIERLHKIDANYYAEMINLRLQLVQLLK